jgi:FkbM family methyltransferase
LFYTYPIKKSLNETLKQYKFLVKIVRFVKKNFFPKIINFFLNFFLIKKIFNSNFFKKITYLSTDNKFLFYQNEKYCLLLLKSDQIISKNYCLMNNYAYLTSYKLKKIKYLFTKEKIIIDTIIDVGASLGNVIVPALKEKYFKYAIAIEPSNIFELLKKNIYLNDLDKFVDTYKVAITSKNNQLVRFELDPMDIGDNRVRYKNYKGLFNEEQRSIIKINTKTLDSLFVNKNLSKSFLWLNNQGSETESLLGSYKILKKFNMPIMLEFCPYFFKINNDFEKFLLFINNLNKKVYSLDKNKFLGKCSRFLFTDLYKTLGERGNYIYLLII